MNRTRPGSSQREYLPIFAVTMALVAIGVLVVYSASYPRAAHDHAQRVARAVQRGERLELPATQAIEAAVVAQQSVMRRQLMWAGVGLLCLLLGFYCPSQWLSSGQLARFLLVLSTALLMAVKLYGSNRGGSERWIEFGPVNVQPSEIAKISLMIYLAGALTRLGQRIREPRWFLRVMAVSGGIAGLILIEPHLGATMVLMATVLAVLLLAGARREHLTLVVAGGLLLVSLSIATHPYQQNRIRAWLHPEQYDVLGYHAVHCGTALARGGPAGRGIGRSLEKFFYLPECYTDSALAVVGEELGLLGCVGLLALFGAFAWRGLAIAETCADPFGRLLAGGLTTLIFFQALFNFGVTTGLLPQTGVGLPFISYGGSSLCCFMGAVGLIMNVSRWCVPPPSRLQRRRQAALASGEGHRYNG